MAIKLFPFAVPILGSMSPKTSRKMRPLQVWEQKDSIDDEGVRRQSRRNMLKKRGRAQEDEYSSSSSSSNAQSGSSSGHDSPDSQDNASGSESPEYDMITHTTNERPGFAQYLDSEEEAGQAGSQSSDESELETKTRALEQPKSKEHVIRQRMEKVPFSTLLKARRAMNDDTDDEDTDIQSDKDEFAADRSAAAERKREKMQRDLEKRENKHAPTEISSRKPVSRRRNVVETSAAQRRDPRFSSLSGSHVNAGVFETSYAFLRNQQSGEVAELRKIHKQLKRQEAHHAGPRAKSDIALKIREERERVEQALRREEGKESERQKRERETAVLRRKKKEIAEHVKQGGKRYFLKDAEKKRLILQDKFEKLSGGGNDTSNGNGTKTRHGALQRAVERRRKRNAARDRSMPLGGGAGVAVGAGFDSRDGAPPLPVPRRKRLAAESGEKLGSVSSSHQAATSFKAPRKRGRRG